MNNKKYYICVTPFFPSPKGWQGAYVLDQVKSIQRNSDFDVIVFKTCALNDKQDDYTIDGIRVHTIRPLLMPSYILNGATEAIVGCLFVRTLYKLNINPKQVEFVHCHTTSHTAFGLGLKKKNSKVKVLVQFHDLDPFTLRNGKWAEKQWNRRYRARKSISAINRVDLLICISEPVRDALLAFPYPRKGEVFPPALQMLKMVSDMPSVLNKKVYVLNNGVDINMFYPKAIKTKDSIFRIGCIANFQDLKDHKTLVKAFNILIKKGYADMRLSLLGSGVTRTEIERYLKENEIFDFVEWPTEVHHDKLPEFYHSLDLFVLPSYYEGFGCVYTEAFACGVPFMGCYDQGAAECISLEERDQWLIKPHDYEQLANLIERQYKERNEQHLCQPYDIDELISNFIEYLRTI